MTCPNCGWPLSNGSYRCSRCGFEAPSGEADDGGPALLDPEGGPAPPQLTGLFRPGEGERFFGACRCVSLDEEKERELNARYHDTNGPGFNIMFKSGAAVDGVLLISDRRLIFFREEVSISYSSYIRADKKVYDLEHMIELETIVGLKGYPNALGIMLKLDDVSLRQIMLEDLVRLDMATLAPLGPVRTGAAKGQLQRLIDDRVRELEAEKKREKVQVVLDFSFLKEALEKGGMVIQSAKCPNCGGMVQLPENGSSVRCEYCGGDLQAYDLLERIRSIIGDIRP